MSSSTWRELSTVARALVVLIPIQALIVTGLTIERIVTLTNENGGDLNNDVKVAIVLALSYIPFTYNAIDAILLENKYQLFSFMLLNAIVLFYVTYDFAYDEIAMMTLKPAKLVRLCVVAVCAPVNVLLGVLTFNEFGWVAARTVGTSVERIVVYERFQRLTALIKSDVQLALTLLLFSLLFLHQDLAFAVADGVLLALSLPWALLLYRGVRHESPLLTKACIVLGVVDPTYIVCRIAFFVANGASSVGSGRQVYIMLSMAVLAILLRIGTLASAVRVWLSFGSGLLETIASRQRPLAKFAAAAADDPLLAP